VIPWLNNAEDRILKSSLWLYTSHGVKLVSSLLLIPLIIFYHGQEQLGLWYTIVAMTSFIHLSDLGMHLPWLNKLTKLYIDSAYKDLSRSIKSGLAIFLLQGLIGVLLSIFIYSLVSPPIDFEEKKTILFFYVLIFQLFVFYVKIIRSILRAFNENPKAVRFEALQDTLVFFVGYSALFFFGVSLITLAKLQLATVFIFFMFAFLKFLNDKRFSFFSISLSDIKEEFKELTPLGRKNLLTTISNAIMTNGPILIISSYLGANSAAIVGAAKTISNIPRQIMSAMHTSSIPEFSSYFAQNKQSTLIFLFKRIFKLTIGINFLATMLIIFSGNFILLNLLLIEYENAHILFLFFSIWCLSEGMKMIIHDSLLGMNEYGKIGLINIVGSCIMIMVIYALIPFLSIYALPASLALINICWGIPALIFVFTKHFQGLGMTSWILKNSSPVFICIIFLIYLSISKI
jgi:O-antigen/teichoic acid export membrane protein